MIPVAEYDRKNFDPTLKQIEDRAAKIRSRWSASVIKRRRVRDDSRWTPPLVAAIELVRELNARNE